MLKQKLIAMLITQLFSLVTPDLMKSLADKLLDMIEDYIENSETKLDDTVILPIIKMVRVAFDIPDDLVVVSPILPEQAAAGEALAEAGADLIHGAVAKLGGLIEK